MADHQEDEEDERRNEAGERLSDIWLLNNALRFWSACPNKRCRRARSCVGDAAQCHAIFWPVVPEEAKTWWRAIFQARRTGRTARQAARAAGEALAEWRIVAARRAFADRALRGEIAVPPGGRPPK
jgi:hypothetical protein